VRLPLAAGLIDPARPSVKTIGVALLAATYGSTAPTSTPGR
jgi:hypothetical protein